MHLGSQGLSKKTVRFSAVCGVREARPYALLSRPKHCMRDDAEQMAVASSRPQDHAFMPENTPGKFWWVSRGCLTARWPCNRPQTPSGRPSGEDGGLAGGRASFAMAAGEGRTAPRLSFNGGWAPIVLRNNGLAVVPCSTGRLRSAVDARAALVSGQSSRPMRVEAKTNRRRAGTQIWSPHLSQSPAAHQILPVPCRLRRASLKASASLLRRFLLPSRAASP